MILNINGTDTEIVVDDSSYRYWAIGSENSLTLKFAFPGFLDIPVISDINSLTPCYEEQNGEIVQIWEISSNDPVKISDKIKFLKTELTSSDYKVIKAQEYALSGLPSEYDISAIHTDRQNLRNQINSLQNLLP